jgi:macrolide transport system ATP-binding/permease protein
VRHLLAHLALPPGRLTYVPQEIDLSATGEILSRARGLPGDRLGHAMMVVSRLGSRPERLLDSDEPSPGEIRKLLLAIHIAQEPHLIVMDEPTNHMDLPSIESLEAALADCPCALVLVSHDEPFLERLTRRRWSITAADAVGEYLLREG